MKRFTETLKWSKPWFRQLPPKHKLLWQWMCDTCDNAGILDADWGLASFQIGCDFTAFDVEVFEGRVTILSCGKVWIPSFITFQCSTLSRDCKAHGPIFASLEKHGIDPDTLTPIGYPIGYKENSNRVYYTHKEKEKEKETDKDKEQEKEVVKTSPANDAGSPAIIELAEGASTEMAEAWNEWQAYRLERSRAKGTQKLAWTARAAKITCKQVSEYIESHGEWVVIDRINSAISGNWQGLNLEKLEAPKKNNSHAFAPLYSTNRPGSLFP